MIRQTALAVLMAVAAVPVVADDRDGWGRDGWGRNDRGRDRGWGSNEVSIVDRTMRDLRSAASRNRVDGHERNHFERALYHLERFRYEFTRDRRFDTSRLNDAIEHIDDLSRAHQVHPRDRDILARDLRALRDFRSRRGSFGWR